MLVPGELGALSRWPWKAADLRIPKMRLLSDHLEMQCPLLTHHLPPGAGVLKLPSTWNVYEGFGDCHCKGKSLYFSEVVMSLRTKPPGVGLVACRYVHHLLLSPFQLCWSGCQRWNPLLMHLYWGNAAAVIMLLWYCSFSVSLGSTPAVPPVSGLSLYPSMWVRMLPWCTLVAGPLIKPRTPVCWCLSRLCV